MNSGNGEEIYLILLAAGESRRFAGDKRRFIVNGVPMLQCAVDTAVQSGLPVVLVIRGEDAAWVNTWCPYGVKIVCNDAPQLGISHSIRLGMAQVPERSPMMFLVADQPYLQASTIVKLVKTYRRHGGIVAAGIDEEAYNPVIFSERYRAELESLQGDTGGKKVALQHPQALRLVQIEAEELQDLDTPPQ